MTPYIVDQTHISVEGYNALKQAVSKGEAATLSMSDGVTTTFFPIYDSTEMGINFNLWVPFESSGRDFSIINGKIQNTGEITQRVETLNCVSANATDGGYGGVLKTLGIGFQYFDLPSPKSIQNIATDLISDNSIAIGDTETLNTALEQDIALFQFTHNGAKHIAYRLNHYVEANHQFTIFLFANKQTPMLAIRDITGSYTSMKKQSATLQQSTITLDIVNDIELIQVSCFHDVTTLTQFFLSFSSSAFGNATTLDELTTNANNKVATGQMTFVEMLGIFTTVMSNVGQVYYHRESPLSNEYFLEVDATKGGYLCYKGGIKDLATFLKEININETTIKKITIR